MYTVAVYTDIMRFLTYYVNVTECLGDTKKEHDLNQTVLTKVLGLKETSHDSL